MRLLIVTATALLLAGCADWNWQETGRSWLGSACKASSNCYATSTEPPATRP